ncbi:hypothetical protein FRC12_013256 [Ceratobasidium sp. 428]|nr:hypothetical protein FRC12_013256 [Ceratobasidium sp. 428]
MTPVARQKHTRRPRQPRPLSVAVSAQPQPRRQHLTYTDKLRILDYYHAHSHLIQVDVVRALRCEYPTLSQSTLSNYLSHEQEIRAYVELNPSHLRYKKPFRVALPDVDAALVDWVRDQLNRGERLTGDRICEKGRWFCEEMNIPPEKRISFSSGWLDNFKERLGLHEVWHGGERTLGLVDRVTPI